MKGGQTSPVRGELPGNFQVGREVTVFAVKENLPDGGVQEALEKRQGGDPRRVLERFSAIQMS